MKNSSELTVITKAKDLCAYIMTVTEKSPKRFRFTFVTRMQNLALDVIEYLYRANDLRVGKGRAGESEQRLEFQRKAMTNLRLLGYFAMLATEQKCILPKQFERISFLSTECMNLLGAWMNSDKKRL